MDYVYDGTIDLDLNILSNQLINHLNKESIHYKIYINKYTIYGSIIIPYFENKSLFTINIKEPNFDNIEEIIIPCIDLRFRDIPYFKSLFPNDHYRALLFDQAPESIINILCTLINLILRIDKLKVFL